MSLCAEHRRSFTHISDLRVIAAIVGSQAGLGVCSVDEENKNVKYIKYFSNNRLIVWWNAGVHQNIE